MPDDRRTDGRDCDPQELIVCHEVTPCKSITIHPNPAQRRVFFFQHANTMTPEERADMAAEIAAHLRRRTDAHLTEEERRWVRMAIQREAQSIELRRAIIEKSLGSLVWSAIAGLGYLLIDYLKNRGFQP